MPHQRMMKLGASSTKPASTSPAWRHPRPTPIPAPASPRRRMSPRTAGVANSTCCSSRQRGGQRFGSAIRAGRMGKLVKFRADDVAVRAGRRDHASRPGGDIDHDLRRALYAARQFAYWTRSRRRSGWNWSPPTTRPRRSITPRPARRATPIVTIARRSSPRWSLRMLASEATWDNVEHVHSPTSISESGSRAID